MRHWTFALLLCSAAVLLQGCPRETESPFYGGQPVRKPFPKAERGLSETGSGEGGVLEGATQPHRQDK